MLNRIHFGEVVDGYEIRVLNEREVRASAGILFLFASIAFANMWFIQNYDVLKWFVTLFMLDFFIRIFLNPSFSPTMILGRLIIKKQEPEFVGAPQKKWAWAIGLFMSTVMFFVIVVFEYKGNINLFVCFSCLLFLFLESVFGICVGCKLYNTFSKNSSQYCAGGACGLRRTYGIQKIDFLQLFILSFFIIISFYILFYYSNIL